MAVQLSQIPGKLRSLSENLSLDEDIKACVNNVVQSTDASVQSFERMMKHEYKEVDQQRSLLRNTKDATEVNVEKLNTSSRNMLKAVILFKNTITSAQKQVNSNLETCRARGKEKQARVNFLRSDKETREKQISELERRISILQNEASQYDWQAMEMSNRARVIDKKAKAKHSRGIWGLLIAGASLLLAPFTLGTSWLLTGGGAIFAGLNFAIAADCRLAAERARSSASDKRSEAQYHNSRKQDVESTLKTIKQEIDGLQKELETINKDVSTLSEITNEMLKLEQANVEISTAFQDEESFLEQADWKSTSFDLVRRTFRNKPEKLATEMARLQSKWEETRAVLQRYGIIPSQ